MSSLPDFPPVPDSSSKPPGETPPAVTPEPIPVPMCEPILLSELGKALEASKISVEPTPVVMPIAPEVKPATVPEVKAIDPLTQIEQLPALMNTVQKAVDKVVVGQAATVEAIMIALITRGHCLLTGVPGLAKTLLVKVISHLVGLQFSRVQFTPDLMPSDITGTEILEEDATTGHRRFIFVPGPIFTQVLLADEINRTPPKTQAALLEAMQEKTVTLAGKIYAMQEPFLVLATQNPIEQEGTYPLPEAQLDRFLFELPILYPSYKDEVLLVERHSYNPTDNLKPLISQELILTLREAITQIPAPPNVVDYAVRLVRATRPEDSTAPEYIKRWIRCGASPRASQNLILAGRARAALQGRFNVACEDIAALAPLILRHRVIRSFHADADNKTTDQIVQQLLGDIKVVI